MAYAYLFVVGCVNAVLAFGVSYVFGIRGDGSLADTTFVRLMLLGWVAAMTVLACIVQAAGHAKSARALAGGTLVLALPAAIVFHMFEGVIEGWRPLDSRFAAACRQTGAEFLAKPAQAVRSIGYDWERDRHPPRISYFEVDDKRAVRNARGGTGVGPAYPPGIAFVESRCCRFEGRPPGTRASFIRREPPSAQPVAIDALTADVLVTFGSETVIDSKGLMSARAHEVAVTDRRDGRPLARLRYIHDARNQRGCGASAPGVMDERAFILQAVGY